MTNRAIIISLSFLLAGICSHAREIENTEDINHWLEGEWVPLDIGNCQKDERTLTFHNGYFTVSSTSMLRYAYSISDAIHQDGYWEMYLLEAMASDDGGQNFFEIGNFNDSDEKIRVQIYFRDNILVLLPHKAEGRTAGQVTMPEAFVRAGSLPDSQYTPSVQSVFVIPDGFTGSAWIAMNQPEGEPYTISEEGLPVIELPPSGLLKSRVPIMAEALAKREFSFYYHAESDSQPIPPVHYKCVELFRSEGFSEEEIQSHGYDLDQVYVLYYRYDVPGGDKISEMFGKRIEGQVLHFQIDTLRDMIAFRGFRLGR
ncbi:MAG: hypothetical protein EA361_06850, partial [Bacteroidetes bacterium]